MRTDMRVGKRPITSKPTVTFCCLVNFLDENMKSPTPLNKDERLLKVHELALELHARALAFDCPGDDKDALNARIMAVMLAAVWVATEGGVPDPWRREYGPAPRLTRKAFLEWAGSMWDGWMRERPRLAIVR